MRFARHERTWWFALILLSLIARLAGLGVRAMSHDESLHALYSFNWSNGLNYRHDPMMHGPLLFHLNGLVNVLLPVTDFTSRIIPALFGTGCVAMLWLYRRWMGKAGAFTAACLVSIEPALLFYSRYLRNDIYIALFTLLMVWAILRYREEQKPRFLLWLSLGLALSFACKEVCFIHGAVFGSACLLFAVVDALRTRKPVLEHPLCVCAFLMLFLALPFASPLMQPDLPWSSLANESEELYRKIVGYALIVFAASTAIATVYFTRIRRVGTFGIALVIFWAINLSLYTTLFTNFWFGLANGIGGSLGYWLEEHEKQRIESDTTLYLSLLLLYSPVLFSGMIYGVCKLTRFFPAFLVYWAAGNFAIYTWAGERVPWLLTHITLPLCLLTGLLVSKLYNTPRFKLLPLKLIIGIGLFHLTVNSLRTAGPNAEGPWEPMVYAHTGADFKAALRIIRYHLDAHPGSWMTYHGDFSWPTVWYLRDLPNQAFNDTPETIPPASVVHLAKPWEREVWAEAGWTPRMVVDMTTWPRPHYHRLSKENFKNVWTLPSVRKKLLRYYLFRDQPEWGEHEWPGPSRFLVLTRDPV